MTANNLKTGICILEKGIKRKLGKLLFFYAFHTPKTFVVRGQSNSFQRTLSHAAEYLSLLACNFPNATKVEHNSLKFKGKH